jgi:hypothetical protein
VDELKPVDANVVKNLVQAAGIKIREQAVQPQAASVPLIEEIRIDDLKCNKNTTGLFGGEARDEIFAIYAGVADGTPFVKTTEILEKVKKDQTRQFPAADRVVFPPADNPTLRSATDIVLVASLFEADPNVGKIATAAKVMLNTAIAVLVVFLVEVPPAAAGILAMIGPLNLTIDQIASGIPAVTPLGDASAVVGLDKKFRNPNGNGVINDLKFIRTDKDGPAPFDFRLQDFSVKVK